MHRVLLAAFVFLSLPAAAQTTGATPLGPGSLVMKKGGPDGIVMFRVTVSEAGTVSGYELMEEYPKGKMLSPGQAEAHMRSLRFKPAFKDGVPVAEETEEVITRDQTGSTRIRSGVMDAIKAELAALKKHDTAGGFLDQVEQSYARGTLSLSELAWYFYLQAPLNRIRKDFRAGRDSASKALNLQHYLGKGPIITALETERILGYLATEPAKALDHYDRWVKRAPNDVPEALTQLVDRYRAAPDQDYTADIIYFGEPKQAAREAARGDGKRPL